MAARLDCPTARKRQQIDSNLLESTQITGCLLILGMKPIKDEGLDGFSMVSPNWALHCCRGHLHHRVSLRIGACGFTLASCSTWDQRRTWFNQVVYGFGWKELGGFTNPKNDEPWLFQSISRGKMMINHQILRVADVVVVHLSHCLRSLAHGEAAITPSVAAAMGRNCWDAERGRRGGGSNSSRLSRLRRRLLFWVLRMCGLSSVAPALWQDWV